jgi:hypothetical protein
LQLSRVLSLPPVLQAICTTVLAGSAAIHNICCITAAALAICAVQGVDNVYTQHQPLLSETLRLLAANDLNAAAYPYMAGSQVRLIVILSLLLAIVAGFCGFHVDSTGACGAATVRQHRSD